MKKHKLVSIIILIILICTTGCSSRNKQEMHTAYIYNISDKSTRTFTEPYDISVSWSPDSQYFSYIDEGSKHYRDKIRQAEDLKVMENPLDEGKYSECSYTCYWNKESNMVVEIKDKGDFWFKPGTKTLHQASKDDKETNIIPRLTEDEIISLKNKFGLSDKTVLSSNADKTRFYYIDQSNNAIFCNIKSGERELTLQIIPYAKWSQKGDKIIYSIPKAGFASIRMDTTVNDAKLFDTYIYDFGTKEKIKIADFYAVPYCSPDDKYIILIPDGFQFLHPM